MPGLPWTLEQDRRLREMYASGYAPSMIAPRLKRSNSAIRNRIHNLQLKRNLYRRPFSDAELRIVRTKYPNTLTPELARQLGRTVCAVSRIARKLGVGKSQEFYASAASGRMLRGSTLGVPSRFMPGHVPANKGLHRPGYSKLHGRMAETTFKKGHRGHNWMPVGSTRLIEGWLYKKVSDVPKVSYLVNWKAVHVMLWEKKRGKVPPGHALIFKDGNRQNITLANLQLISRGELMRRNTIHNLPPELKSTIMWAGALKRRIGRIERAKKEQAERSARSPVRDDRKAQR